MGTINLSGKQYQIDDFPGIYLINLSALVNADLENPSVFTNLQDDEIARGARTIREVILPESGNDIVKVSPSGLHYFVIRPFQVYLLSLKILEFFYLGEIEKAGDDTEAIAAIRKKLAPIQTILQDSESDLAVPDAPQPIEEEKAPESGNSNNRMQPSDVEEFKKQVQGQPGNSLETSTLEELEKRIEALRRNAEPST